MENFESSPLLYNLALTLIHFLWQGGLIALALKFLLVLTPYDKPQYRYTWATAAMLMSFIAPIITYITIYQPDYSQAANQAYDVAAMISTQSLASNETFIWYLEFFDALPYVSIFWLVMVAVLASKLFIELYSVNQLPKIGVVEPDGALNTRFIKLAQQVGLRKTPSLLISLKADIPMAIGWLKPVILIPASMISGLAPAQLDMLILHELAHIRRHDYLVNFIQTLVETLLFFHPCVRWISKQMRNEREYCSDDIAVTIAGDAIAYAHTLADTATICSKHRHHAIPTMAMAASGGDLKQRVVRLVDQHHCSSTDDSGKFLASVLIIFSVVVVAIKPYLNSNIIDFTSGRISLFQTANEFIQQKPSSSDDLSATSIARLLLQQDKATDNEAITITDNNFVDAQPFQKVVENSQTVKSVNNNNDTPFNAFEGANNKIANDTTSVDKRQQITISKVNSDQPIRSQQTNKDKSIENSNNLLANNQALSISEQAFERTDSSNKNIRMNNPYSSQVADLSKEPNYDNSTADASENTRDHLISPVKKKQVKPTIKKPLFTISSAEKKEVVKPKLSTKSAEILTSTDPKYPSTAKRKGIEIDVTVEFIIDVNGYVKDIEFEQKSKVSYFRNAIRTAMAKWRFLPAQVNNKPVESKMSKIFSFSLMK